MNKNIALIGCGNIGSRHLQALARLKDATIFVVEPHEASRNTAQQRVADVGDACANIHYVETVEQLHGPIDVAIVATSADVRRAAIDSLVGIAPPRHLVLEKVLFQRRADYDYVAELLARHHVRAWVNCPRRMWTGYRDLRARIGKRPLLQLQVSGSDWGIASNAIHFFDLARFLGASGDLRLWTEQLEPPHASRRPSYFEIRGTLGARIGTTSIVLTSFASAEVPVVVELYTDAGRYFVCESESKLRVSEGAQAWSWREEPFGVAFQSGLSDCFVTDLLAGDDCELTRLEESSALHIPFVVELARYFGQGNSCPIT